MTGNRKTFEIPLGRILSVAPVLATTDIARTVAHYRRLGFVSAPLGPDSVDNPGSVIAERDGIGLHFVLRPDHDHPMTR